jgi:hypothetical protein
LVENLHNNFISKKEKILSLYIYIFTSLTNKNYNEVRKRKERTWEEGKKIKRILGLLHLKKMQRPKMSKDKPKKLSASELISQPYGASSGSCSSHRYGEKNAKIALNVKKRPIKAFFSF